METHRVSGKKMHDHYDHYHYEMIFFFVCVICSVFLSGSVSGEGYGGDCFKTEL